MRHLVIFCSEPWPLSTVIPTSLKQFHLFPGRQVHNGHFVFSFLALAQWGSSSRWPWVPSAQHSFALNKQYANRHLTRYTVFSAGLGFCPLLFFAVPLNGNPLQYSCLENPMDGGGWWAPVHGSQRVWHDWATSLSLSLLSSNSKVQLKHSKI